LVKALHFEVLLSQLGQVDVQPVNSIGKL
jgi:hypothetical protein